MISWDILYALKKWRSEFTVFKGRYNNCMGCTGRWQYPEIYTCVMVDYWVLRNNKTHYISISYFLYFLLHLLFIGHSIPLVQLQEEHGLVQADLGAVQILQACLHLRQHFSFRWRQYFHYLQTNDNDNVNSHLHWERGTLLCIWEGDRPQSQ